MIGDAGHTLDQLLDRGRVEGGHHGVARLHGLEGDVALLTTNLADDDLVGALAEGGLQQVEHCDAGAFAGGATDHLAQPVRVRNLHLRRVLDA